jgi:hypothetical protein
MNDIRDPDSAERTVDPILAELTEQLTRKLQAGEVVDVEDWCRRYPRCAGPIRRLLPTLRQLAGLDPATEPCRGKHPFGQCPLPDKCEPPAP